MWLLVLLALATGCAPRSRPVASVQARMGSIDQSFTELAETRLRRTWSIAMPTTARLQRIDIEPGDPVRRGQILARLDLERDRRVAAEALHEVAQIRAQIALNDDRGVEEAERAQALAQVEVQRSGLRAAVARLRTAKARHAQARVDRGRYEQLWTERYCARKDVDDAVLAERTAFLEVQQAHAEVAGQEREVRAVEERVRQVEASIGHKAMQRQVLERQAQRARERVEQALHEAREAYVRSPIDGLVLERPQQGPGEIAGGTPLLLLGTMRDLEVMSEVLTEDALALRVDDPVVLDSGSAVVRGAVDRIEPSAFTKRSSLGVEQKRVRVFVRLSSRRSLGVGYRLQARFITDHRDRALLVPRFALTQQADGTPCVIRVRDGRLSLQTVKLGLRSDEDVEIVAGLRAGDEVASMPTAEMLDEAASPKP
jgi:HlyD family secretion protein